MRLNRRQFNQISLSSLAYFSAVATTPAWIARSARAMQAADCLPPDRILVILQQAGGNDGLNTVIPRTDPVYYDDLTRPTIHVPAGSEINLDGLNGLHPRLSRLADWHQSGNLAIVQNVGYVNPNLSHFISTDHYEFGFAPGESKPLAGWVARLYDSKCGSVQDQDPLFMLASGLSGVPDSMQGSAGYTAPAVKDAATYGILANQDAELRLPAISALNSLGTLDPTIEFVQRSANLAEASAQDIATAAAEPDLVPPGSYPENRFGQGLRLVSQIIRAGFQTRIFYVSQGGYDTHASQIEIGDPLNAGNHPQLLDAFDRAVDSFLTEMELTGNLDRVLLMTFSEFGRRVEENGSAGTDHGAANSLFVLGGEVLGGVYGGQPNLTDLIRGNLKHQVDFRSVYSMVIERWFGASAAAVFGESIYSGIISPDFDEIPFLPAPGEASGLMLR
jgi:uncharacterized protein (DUF1501 family)